jgi:hypothetical protein
MLPIEVEEKLVELLAVIYAKVPWGKRSVRCRVQG